ncbi:unnamed protein product, partial [Symbiodinium sp. CCMP2456]
ASFLAGQSGQTRLQKTLEEESDRTAENAPAPEVVESEGPVSMPYPGHVVPDDTMLSDLLPPPLLLRTSEPPTPSNPSAVTPAHMLPSLTPHPEESASSPMPMLVEESVGDGGAEPEPAAPNASASASLPLGGAPSAPASSTGVTRPEPETAGGAVPPARKKLRLDAVQASAYDAEMFHHDEPPELFDEAAEEFLDCEIEQPQAQDWDDGEPTPEIPAILIRPESESEPVCSAAELEAIDAAADALELARLTSIGVLEQCECWREGHRSLSSKYVRSWRLKVLNGEKKWLRRSRLVAREFAHLDPDRQHLFAPTTTQCMLRIVPALFIRNFGDNWALLSLDVSDAFLQCQQQHATLTKVDGFWYKLHRMLPGQRDGSATWFADFMQEVKAAVSAEPLAEQPVLFRIPRSQQSVTGTSAEGAGMIHVDDVLAAGLTWRLEALEKHLKGKFKVSSDWIREVGDQVTFLKRRHILVSPMLL